MTPDVNDIMKSTGVITISYMAKVPLLSVENRRGVCLTTTALSEGKDHR
jgi:hypothetical protein